MTSSGARLNRRMRRQDRLHSDPVGGRTSGVAGVVDNRKTSRCNSSANAVTPRHETRASSKG